MRWPTSISTAFCVPDHHGPAAELFEDWEKEQGRVFGRLDDSIVRLTSGDSFSPTPIRYLLGRTSRT